MAEPLIFLTCMRSFSSLACGMLGQHPAAFALPEMNLFMTDTVGQALGMFSLVRPRSLDGMVRAVAELEFGGQGEAEVAKARAWLEERGHWTGRHVLLHLERKLAPRFWIDKSPSTVVGKGGMQRAFAQFPKARFLHLTRHPQPTCVSIHKVTSANRNKGLAALVSRDTPDAEESWLRINCRILAFVATLPPGQAMHLRGEDLLGDPERFLPQLCEWLEIDYDAAALAAMLAPEKSPFACIGPPSAPFGNDPIYLREPSYRRRPLPEVRLTGRAEWRADGGALRRDTVAIARQLGYQ